MRRLIYICLFVAIVPWIVIGIVREATDDDTKDHYFVRAVFDNASSIVSGEDVKVAGVPVGVVSSMDVTDDNKAAVTLQINDEKFTPFKTDANCKIRLQGLIGSASSSASRAPPRPPSSPRSRTAPARANACCRSTTTARRSTSTCSTTSCACRTASASRSC